MADKFLNLTDLAAIKAWIEGKFATLTGLNALDDKVETIIAEGGEPNVIEIVKQNGTPLVPDGNKAVNVTVPEDLSDLTNTGNDPYATEGYVDQNGGKIDSISVNGTAQTIDANKNVDIAVPADVAELTDATGVIPDDVSDLTDSTGIIPSDLSDLTNTGADPYATQGDVTSAIATAVSAAYKYKGSVANQAALPASGNTTGDVYDVQDTGMNYAWNGSAWDALGTYVDTSVFWTSTSGQSNTLEAATVAEVNAVLEPSA